MFNIAKVLKRNLRNVDMVQNPNLTLLSFTEDGSVYINGNNGVQKKITDVITVTDMDLLHEVHEDKIYIVNGIEKSIVIKVGGQLIDILADTKKHITDITNDIQQMKDDSLVKEYKAIVALSNIRVGIVDPIIPVSSFIFNANQKVKLISVEMHNIGTILAQGFEVDIDLYNENDELIKNLNIMNPSAVSNKLVKNTFNISEQNKVLVNNGYYKINVKKANVNKEFKSTIVLQFVREETIVTPV